MQHELLMVLAGYSTSLNMAINFHPSEQDIFDKAIEFGSRFKSVKLLCRETAGPLARVVERMVVQPYLKCLVEIETQILSGKGIYGCASGVSLAAIFSNSVYKWDRRMEYSQDLLEFDGSVSDLIAQVQVDTLSGYPQIAEIAKSCLLELDKAWLRDISSWVLWGQPLDWATAKMHPTLDKETTRAIWDIGFCLNKIEVVNFCQTAANRETLMANSEIFDSIAVPISLEDIRMKIQQIKERLFSSILEESVFTNDITTLLLILRKIVLAGSGSYIRSFLDTLDSASGQFVEQTDTGLLHRAISTYAEDYDEINGECVALSEKILKLEPLPDNKQTEDNSQLDDFLFGIRVCLELNVEWPLNLYFTEQQCRVYADISCYLLTVAMVMARVDASREIKESYRYRIFLKTLWSHFQWSLDKLFAEVTQFCEGIPGQTIDQHNKALKTIGRQLLFDDFETRKAMRYLLTSALAASEGREMVDGIAYFFDALAPRTDLSELMLLLDPFTKIP